MEFHTSPETGKTADCNATINSMIPVWLIVVGVLYALVVLYFAIKYREFRKFIFCKFRRAVLPVVYENICTDSRHRFCRDTDH